MEKYVDYILLDKDLEVIYFKILTKFADSTIAELNIDSELNPIRMFNMFESAIAARRIGNTKLFDLLIKYIKINLN